MADHLTESDVDGFLRDRLAPAAKRRAVRHLVSGCPACLARLFSAVPPERPFWKKERPPEDAYDAPIARAYRAVRKLLPRIADDRQRRERGLALLRERGSWTNITWPELRSFDSAWAHIEIQLQLSFDARHRDPKEMLDHAEGAQQAVDVLRGWRYGDNLLFDLRARVWGELGNAYRVNERYKAADAAFATAQRLLDRGTGDLAIRAHLYDLESSLRRATLRYDDALELLEEVIQIYRRLGEQHLVGRTLMRKGSVLFFARRLPEAIKWLRTAISAVDAARDPNLAAEARHNLLDALVEAGRLSEAGQFFLKSGLGQAFADDPLNRLRLRWVEAKILARRKRLADAERAFGDVREGFRERGLTYDAALAGMDLATVRVKQGKSVQDLAWEMYSEARRQGINPQAVAALYTFESLSRYKAATVPRLERIRGFLVDLQRDPWLRFDVTSAISG